MFVSETPKVKHRHSLIDDELAQPHHIRYRSHNALIVDLVVPLTIFKLTRLLCESQFKPLHRSCLDPSLIPKSTKADVDSPQTLKSSVCSVKRLLLWRALQLHSPGLGGYLSFRMRISTSLLIAFLSTACAISIPAPTPTACPFTAPLLPGGQADPFFELLRRQNACQAGYSPCTNLGAPNACCNVNAICTVDPNNHVACCPTGASCTGTIGATGSTSSGLLVAGAGATVTTGNTIASTTGNSLFPATTANFVQSTVANQYFPFLYIPTTFANAGVCSSYYTSCQSEYSSCITSLGGAVKAATTAPAATNIQLTARQLATATGSAASVCSSLYSQGCYNLQQGYCASLSGATGAATGSGIIISASGAEKTIYHGSRGLVGVGLAMLLGFLVQLL